MTTPARYPLPSGAASPLQPEVKPACNIPTRSARKRESTPHPATGPEPACPRSATRSVTRTTGPTPPDRPHQAGPQSGVEFRWGQAHSSADRCECAGCRVSFTWRAEPAVMRAGLGLVAVGCDGPARLHGASEMLLGADQYRLEVRVMPYMRDRPSRPRTRNAAAGRCGGPAGGRICGCRRGWFHAGRRCPGRRPGGGVMMAGRVGAARSAPRGKRAGLAVCCAAPPEGRVPGVLGAGQEGGKPDTVWPATASGGG
jgi:hypothetical protein